MIRPHSRDRASIGAMARFCVFMRAPGWQQHASQTRMDDKSALLNQLRIDRGSASAPSGRGRIWLGVAAAIVAIAAVAAWWWTRPGAVPVHIAAAQAIAGDGAAAAGSILDASGYVVARRQATVASKITAKMVELDIEEGDHVNAGQIIAKLDDTNIRAALNQASAQLDYLLAGNQMTPRASSIRKPVPGSS